MAQTTVIDGITVKMDSHGRAYKATIDEGKNKGKARCQGVTGSHWWNQCDKVGGYIEDGMAWCGIHAPSKVDERQMRVRAKQAVAAAERAAQYDAEQAKVQPLKDVLESAGFDLEDFVIMTRARFYRVTWR